MSVTETDGKAGIRLTLHTLGHCNADMVFMALTMTVTSLLPRPMRDDTVLMGWGAAHLPLAPLIKRFVVLGFHEGCVCVCV